MCTFIGQIAYGSLISLTLLTTLIAMFSPQWRSYYRDGNQIDADKELARSGLFTCNYKGAGSCFSGNTAVENIVSICLIFALLTELTALTWIIASLFACCFRKWFLYPLPGLAGAISLFLFLSILLFALKHGQVVEDSLNMSVDSAATLGYSFYICCVSLVFSLGSVGAGIWIAFFMERNN